MSQQRKIHLFNCDRTYKFDAVKDWLTRTNSKLGIEFTVKEHYFPLSQMAELSSETIPGLQMDFAVFVVHAHESRLSINEENAGIGYAKIYKALLNATGNNVIIVIGGDDCYKNEDEEDREFISRWARRKISSQFSEDFLDGRKSFIFSWDKKHREIHEEALQHFLNPSKKGQKFEYQPKQKPSQNSATSLPPRAAQQPRGGSGPLQCGTFAFEEKLKVKGTYPSISHGNETRENPLLYAGKGGRCQTTAPLKIESDPLQYHTSAFQEKLKVKDTYPSVFHGKETRENPPLYTGPAPLKIERKDLSVLGWNANPDSLSAVSQLIQKHRGILNLATDPDVLNGTARDMISYLENHPLKYCVLVVDAEKVKDARNLQRGDYLELQKTAERNVAVKIIIIVCCPQSLSQEDESIVNRTIEGTFHNNSKVCVTWFVNGKLALEPEDFVMLLTSNITNTRPCPQQWSSAAQIPGVETNQLTYTRENAASGSSGDVRALPYPTVAASVNQFASHSSVIMVHEPFRTHTNYYDYKIVLPPGKTIMVKTRLRYGNISNRPEDVEYWMPGFAVPDEMARDLRKKNSKNSNAELVILLGEKGDFICQVDIRRGIEWQHFLILALDETVVLKTRFTNGKISFAPQDVAIRYQNWNVPGHVIQKLQQDFRTTFSADLFIISDSKGNLRTAVDEPVGHRRTWNAFCW